MEQELLQEIASYWGTRAEGYSEVNEKELAGSQREAWLHVLEEQFPEKKKEEMKILDIGTGPGFFPMILSEVGYTVTAVDYTEEMLEKAKENLGKYTKYGLERVTLQRMDAQNLEFADETFDVVISRNLTWNLEKPEQAYQEWMRVLKPGGVLLNFDANWYGYLYDEEKKEAYEADRKKVEEQQLDDHYLCTDIDRMENICDGTAGVGYEGARIPRRLFHSDRFRNLEARLERGRETELCIDTDVSGARGKKRRAVLPAW